MYCPKCSTEAVDESKYCRLCGVNLLPVSVLVKGQDFVGAVRANGDIAANITCSRMMQCGIAILFIGLVATIIFGVLNLDILAGLSSAILIAGAGLTVYPWLPGLMNKELGKYAVRSVEQREANQSSQPELSARKYSSQDKKFKTSEMYPLPSITEHTTKKLDENRLREKALVGVPLVTEQKTTNLG